MKVCVTGVVSGLERRLETAANVTRHGEVDGGLKPSRIAVVLPVHSSRQRTKAHDQK